MKDIVIGDVVRACWILAGTRLSEGRNSIGERVSLPIHFAWTQYPARTQVLDVGAWKINRDWYRES
jgi:hypothetical protein